MRIECASDACRMRIQSNPPPEVAPLLLSVPFVRCNGVCPGGSNVLLTRPNNRKVKHIEGDGNCLFRSFSYIITGSEEHHMDIRCAIVNHMVDIAHLLCGAHVPSQHMSIQQYIAATRMNHSASWETDVEIYTLSHLLHTSVFHLWHGGKEMVKIFIGYIWKCVQCWKGNVHKASKNTLWCGMWCIRMFYLLVNLTSPCIIWIVCTSRVFCKLYKMCSETQELHACDSWVVHMGCFYIHAVYIQYWGRDIHIFKALF